MSAVNESIKEAWEDRQGPIVLTTVGIDGNPNNIYATNVSMNGDDKIVIANKYIDRSMKNRLSDSTGSLVFVTSDKRAYLVKGDVQYDYGGSNYKFMRSWNDDRHPGHGAAVFNIDEVYEDGQRVI
jgi:hypothetical protein